MRRRSAIPHNSSEIALITFCGRAHYYAERNKPEVIALASLHFGCSWRFMQLNAFPLYFLDQMYKEN
jgi:hypothetical protein